MEHEEDQKWNSRLNCSHYCQGCKQRNKLMMKKNFFIKTTVAVDAVRKKKKIFGAKIQIVYLGVEDVLFKLRKCGLSGAQTSSRSKSNPEKK